jgi:hypothetical protein
MLNTVSFPVASVGTADPGTYLVDLQPTNIRRTNSIYASPTLRYQASTGLLQLTNLTANNSVTTNYLAVNNQVITPLTLTSNLSVSGYTTLQTTSEVIVPITSTFGSVTYDCSQGSIFYHSSVTGSISANFVNVPITNNRSNVISVIIAQGATPYGITAVQINNFTYPIKYVNAATSVATASRTEFWTFDLIRVSNTWIVTNSVGSYG